MVLPLVPVQWGGCSGQTQLGVTVHLLLGIAGGQADTVAQLPQISTGEHLHTPLTVLHTHPLVSKITVTNI